MDVDTFLALLGAVGVGGLLGQYVSGAPDRRRARADVRRGVIEVERLRWYVGDLGAWDQALRDVMAASLAASLPRPLIDTYIYAAQASRAIIMDSEERTGWSGIERDVNGYIESTRDLLIDYLWHPWWTRFRLRGLIDKLEARRKELTDGAVPDDDAIWLKRRYRPV